jgi:hypothetical protein
MWLPGRAPKSRASTKHALDRKENLNKKVQGRPPKSRASTKHALFAGKRTLIRNSTCMDTRIVLQTPNIRSILILIQMFESCKSIRQQIIGMKYKLSGFTWWNKNEN